ncbi:hypothetical protein [Pseudomonas sp. B16120]|uniref:hypothetical protein n=1 Tax=Pseudomonas sp. B16120 TaxID=3235108 RepID=UPI003782DDCD
MQNTDKPERYTLAWLFVYLTSWNVFIVFTFFALCFIVFRGFALGMAMLCTGLGFLLINSKLDNNIKSLYGLGLAFVGYLVCLPGTFRPVEQVVIDKVYAVGFGAQQVVVTVDAGNCGYDLRSSKLTCDAHVVRVASTSPDANITSE